MESFGPLITKLDQWRQSSAQSIDINGTKVEHSMLVALFLHRTQEHQSADFWIFPDEQELDRAYEFLQSNKDYLSQTQIIRFPGLELNPYAGFLFSEKDLLDRCDAMSKSFSNSKSLVLCTHESARLLIPPKEEVAENFIKIEEKYKFIELEENKRPSIWEYISFKFENGKWELLTDALEAIKDAPITTLLFNCSQPEEMTAAFEILRISGGGIFHRSQAHCQ